MKRRLSVILAIDMVGYSRLMEVDETGTIRRHNKFLSDIFRPEFNKHGGRIVKLMGDGILVEFSTVGESINCAVLVQQQISAIERDVSTSSRITYRIGINIGDVIVEGDDLLGDGVNIAARLEKASEPGGICISGAVYDIARSNSSLKFHSQSDIHVKNIARAIRVYHVDVADNSTIEKPTSLLTSSAEQSSGTRWPYHLLLLSILLFIGIPLHIFLVAIT